MLCSNDLAQQDLFNTLAVLPHNFPTLKTYLNTVDSVLAVCATIKGNFCFDNLNADSSYNKNLE